MPTTHLKLDCEKGAKIIQQCFHFHFCSQVQPLMFSWSGVGNEVWSRGGGVGRGASVGDRGVPGGIALEARTRGFQKRKGRTCRWSPSLTQPSALAGYVLSAPCPGEACGQHPGTGMSALPSGTTASFPTHLLSQTFLPRNLEKGSAPGGGGCSGLCSRLLQHAHRHAVKHTSLAFPFGVCTDFSGAA